MLCIGEEWRLYWDGMNIQLQNYKDVNVRGKEEIKHNWVTVGYYGRWEHALKGVIRKNLGEAKDVEEWLCKLEELYEIVYSIDDELMKSAVLSKKEVHV